MYDTFLYHLMWIKCVYLSRYIFHVHLNMICTSEILRQQKRTFEQTDSKFYKTEALTSTFDQNLAELFNHMDEFRPSTRTHGYSRQRLYFRVLCVSSAHLPYEALLSIDGINACLSHVALMFLLLQHTHNTLVSSSNHYTYCT
jgi:hypothetical protein